MNRRQFLQTLLGAAGSAVAVVPLIGPWLAPLFAKKRPDSEYVPIGYAYQFANKQPKLVPFTQKVLDAWDERIRSRSVFVTFLEPGKFRIQSPICPHLGCSIGYDGEAKQFACPCHASRFSAEGEVQGGPAPRRMDELPYKIENGQILVKWVDYKTGISAREEA